VPKDTVITNTATASSDTQDPTPADSTAHDGHDSTTTTVDTQANLSASKTDGETTVVAGDGVTYTYTITVHNSGPSDAQAVSVSDTWPAGFAEGTITPSQGSCTLAGGTGPNFTCALGVVAAGADASIDMEYTVPSTTDSGAQVNSATATSTTFDPSALNNTATDSTTVTEDVNLAVTKSFSSVTVTAGSSAVTTFTVSVKNNGVSDADNLHLNDNVTGRLIVDSVANGSYACPDGDSNAQTITCTLAHLAAGDTKSITVTYHVAASTLDDPAVGNTGTAYSDEDNDGDSGSASVGIITRADLSITKSDSPEPVVAGTNLTYTIVATNNGPSDAQAVTISDGTPSGTTFVSATPSAGGSCPGTPAVGGTGSFTCTWAGATVPTGTRTLTFVVKVNANVLDGATLSNTVSTASSTTDPGPGLNSATETTGVIARADLSITKSDSPDPVIAGTNLTYTIVATNNGPSDAQNVQISDATPTGTTFVSATPSAGGLCGALAPGATGTETCTWIGATAPGVSRTVTLVVKVNADVLKGTTITNGASTSSSTTDPGPNVNTASTDTLVDALADVSITKTDSPDPVFINNTITYTITVHNDGPSDAQAVSVADTLPARLSSVAIDVTPGSPTCETTETFPCNLGTVAAGATVVITVTANVDPVSPINTSMSNTATVTSTTDDPNDASHGTSNNNTATATTGVGVRTVSLVYGGGTSAIYSDSLSLSATLMDTTPTLPYGPIPISGKTITFTITCTAANGVGDTTQTTSAPTNASGVASTTLRIYLKPQSTCTVVASFAGDTTYQPKSTAPGAALTINKEGADVSIIDPSVIALSTSNKNSSGNLTQLVLTVTVDENNDGEPSKTLTPAGKPNLVGTQVSLMLSPVGAGSTYGPCIATLTAYVSGNDYRATGMTGAACAAFQNVQTNLYEVDATIVNSDYFVGTGAGVLLIYDPTAGMTTGGGWFTAADGSRVNFGFNAKFLKSGQAQGNFLAIWHRASGNYIVKSNSMGPSAITGPFGTSPNQYWVANLTGKATYQVPTGTLWCGSNKCGNFSWQVYVEDIKEPGAGFDHFWMTMNDPNTSGTPTVVAVSMSSPTLTYMKTITGGNIQIPH
jgi:uncharacterized repeat protein (TIGR01451 family)